MFSIHFCYYKFSLSEMMMTAGISTMDLYIILIVVVVAIVIFALVLACYFFHRKHARHQQGNQENQQQMYDFSLTAYMITNTDISKTKTWFSYSIQLLFSWIFNLLTHCSVSSHSISVEWFDAETHSSTTDEGLKEHLHRDSVDLNLILRRGDKMTKPITHRTTTTTYV